MIEKKCAMITGASRGLGRQIALNLASPETHLMLLSRSEQDLIQVRNECETLGADVFIIKADLAHTDYQKKLCDHLAEFDVGCFLEISLFNNASTIKPISELVDTTSEQQNELMQINLLSSIWITSEFLRFAEKINPRKVKIANISSGVSRKPVQGWSLYCISKAAINMLSASLAQESSRFPFSIFSVAINPGAMDTKMQEVIRESDEKHSPIALKFREVYDTGELKNVKDVALKIIEIIHSESYDNGAYIDFNLLPQ